MDYRDNWFIYDNKLINDVNNFGVSIVLGITNKPVKSPVQIEAGGIAFILNVYDRVAMKRTECLFASYDDATYFLNYYLSHCKNILDVINNYKSFCISEEAIYVKGYTS